MSQLVIPYHPKAFSEEPCPEERGAYAELSFGRQAIFSGNLERKALSPATLPPSMNVVIGVAAGPVNKNFENFFSPKNSAFPVCG